MLPIFYVTNSCFVFLTLRIANDLTALYEATFRKACEEATFKRADSILQRFTGRNTLNCQESPQMLDHLERFYLRCYTPGMSRFSSALLGATRNSVGEFCTRNPTTFKTITLVSPETASTPACMQKLIAEARNSISPNGISKAEHSCCKYSEILTCTETYIRAVPCVQKGRKSVLEFIRSLTGNILKQACQSASLEADSPVCYQIQETPLNGTVSRNRQKKKQKSTALLVLLNLTEYLTT